MTDVTLSNPLMAGLQTTWRAEPSIMVIFGGSGDLARRKLMPSLYHLESRGDLPDNFCIIGFARSKRTREDYQGHIREALNEFVPEPIREEVWGSLANRLYYISSDFDNDSGYRELSEALIKLSTKWQTGGSEIFYLATPPSFFGHIIGQIRDARLSQRTAERPGWKRIVIEKPFGRDLESARELNDLVATVFPESDIFRVDHYMGKDTVQNIVILRFANAIFEPLWNRRYIEHIQITASEVVGVEGRGDYYEEAGALRDMVQNHCLQMMALIAMEPPATFSAEDIRDEKAKVMRSIRRISPNDANKCVVRGQYGPGFANDAPVPGYRDETDVSPDSETETFAAARFFVDNWRWQDVPFYVRTGKRLARKKTEVAIQFKPVPHGFFGPTSSARMTQNALIIRIEPDAGVSIRIETKTPGPTMRPRPVEMDFHYLSSLGISPTDAYEKLLLDCMTGDQTLFARRDAVEEAWAVINPVLQGWRMLPTPSFPNYEAGGWQPESADSLLAEDGHRWRMI